MTKQDKQKTQQEVPLQQALKDCRLAASLSIEDVALTLNLNVTVIRNIEDNLAQIIEKKTYPSIYLRGYLANYAKAINLQDLESYPQYQQLSHPEKSVSSLKNPHILNEKKKAPIKLIAGLSLLILIAVITAYILNDTNVDAVDIKMASVETENTEMRLPQVEIAEPVIEQVKVQAEKENSEIESNSDATPVVDEDSTIIIDVEATEPVTTEQANVDNKETIVDANSSAVSTESVAVITHSLVVKFKEDCWTEITDATGKRLALDLYKAGRELTLAGTPPFNLVLGNPFVVELIYQDKLVERDYKRGRTARFTLPE